METFGKFMTVVLGMIISPIINGFVILKMWAWFVVPIFETHPLKLAEAIGLMFLVNYLKIGRNKETTKDNFWGEFVTNIFFLIIMSGFALLSGWVVTLFLS